MITRELNRTLWIIVAEERLVADVTFFVASELIGALKFETHMGQLNCCLYERADRLIACNGLTVHDGEYGATMMQGTL